MLKSYLATSWQLVKRDLHVTKKELKNLAIDAALLTIVELLLFGKLMPMIGMPSAFIIPVYLGSIIMFIFFRASSFADTVVYDLEFNRIIDYQLTLPMPATTLLITKIVGFMMQTMIVTLPQLFIGLAFLQPDQSLLSLSTCIYLTLFYPLILFFFGSLFLFFSFHYQFHWFITNIWVRRCEPLLMVSTIIAPWHTIYELSPLMAAIVLINPVSYAIEGLRTIIMQSPNALPLTLCTIGLLIASAISFILASNAFAKKVDHLQGY